MTLDVTEVKNALRDYIRRELMNRPEYPLKDSDSLINGGLLDSFALVDIAVFIEERFNVYIPNEAIDADKLDTLECMADFVLEWQNHDPL
jgi:acyl carrier protein